MADGSFMLLQALAAVVTKIASASTVAQVAAGLGVAVAGVTGAGAAGVLPGPIQAGVAGAIEAVTPFDLPDSAADRGPGVGVRPPAVATGNPEAEHSAGASPSEIPAVLTPAAPSASRENEVEKEVEAGGDDGIHQHRGGRTGTAVGTAVPRSAAPTAAPAPVVDDSPEVEVHDDAGADDRGSHGGNSAGDSSGHGGGDD